MVVERDQGATSTLLADGRVLVTGGRNGSVTPGSLSSAEIYDPATGQWTKTGPMARAHSGHTATLLKDGRVLIVAGCDTHATAEIYDPATGKFSPAAKVAVDSTCASTATLLADGRVLIAGGYGVSSASKLAELFDPATGKFTRTGSLHTARGDAQAALLPDSRVLVIGGDQATNTPSEVDLDSAEIYDPATGKFSEAGKMETPRTDFSATLLTNGKVLVAGGEDINAAGPAFFDSAELYDPATGQFSPTGSMTVGRSNASAVDWGSLYTSLLADGRALFAGGADLQSATERATAEIYDPATGKFSATTSPPPDKSPYGIPAVTLKDGRVLIPGDPSLLYTP
jgi:WD40 repeat protein